MTDMIHTYYNIFKYRRKRNIILKLFQIILFSSYQWGIFFTAFQSFSLHSRDHSVHIKLHPKFSFARIISKGCPMSFRKVCRHQFLFFFFAEPTACGSSWARDQTWATAAALSHRSDDAGSLTYWATRELLYIILKNIDYSIIWLCGNFLHFPPKKW